MCQNTWTPQKKLAVFLLWFPSKATTMARAGFEAHPVEAPSETSETHGPHLEASVQGLAMEVSASTLGEVLQPGAPGSQFWF